MCVVLLKSPSLTVHLLRPDGSIELNKEVITALVLFGINDSKLNESSERGCLPVI